MNRPSPSERRQNPRIDQNLPINVVANGYDFMTQTKNVSCLGAYCHIDKYVPPFTKVKIKMALPMQSGRMRVEKEVECEGVIVRSEDAASGGFNVAIYFNRIKELPRQDLASYVNQVLTSDIAAN